MRELRVRAAGTSGRRGETDLDDDLVRTERRLEGLLEELARGNVPTALWADDADRRVEREGRCGLIRCGIRVGKASTDGAARTHLQVSDGSRGFRERGERLGGRRAVGDRPVCRERADDDGAILALDLTEAGDAADVDQQFGLGEPELHQGNETVAAGQHLRVARPTECFDRLVDGRGRCVGERVRDHRRASPALRMACQTFSAVSGMSICLMPSGDSASITALTIAGVDAIVPASPIPLTPSGFVFVSVTVWSSANGGTSAAVGTWYSIMLPDSSWPFAS